MRLKRIRGDSRDEAQEDKDEGRLKRRSSRGQGKSLSLLGSKGTRGREAREGLESARLKVGCRETKIRSSCGTSKTRNRQGNSRVIKARE